MIVLGISGLSRSVDVKRSRYPGLPERQYRMVQGLDAAAALLVDGQLVAAAAEERFSREKGTNAFPKAAIDYVLSEAGISASDIDRVAHNFDYEAYLDHFSRSEAGSADYAAIYSAQLVKDDLDRAYPAAKLSDKLVKVAHHAAHAASAFYCSDFDESLVLVSDGIGEFHSCSVYSASADGLELVSQIPGLHSVGLLYGLVTYHLGFFMNMDEYKVMGLAPYGDPERYRSAIDQLLQLAPNGRYLTPALFSNATDYERETYAGTLAEIETVLGPARQPDAELTQNHMDIAAALQAATGRASLHVLKHAVAERPSSRLCVAGGVALNCTANNQIRSAGLFKDIFFQPASGDDGTAIGAAQYDYFVNHRDEARTAFQQRQTMLPPLFGPAYTDSQIAEAIEAATGVECLAHFDDVSSVAEQAAELIRDGSVLAWFQGRMEFGPRALGNRSILADPRRADMKDIINSMVKKREGFRPFAPAAMSEHAAEIFNLIGPDASYWYMLEIVKVKPEWRQRLAAVTHVDGTARLQTVRSEHNPGFWAVIDAFRGLTGVPVLLNTSFNVKGQPIVRTPAEAISTFRSTALDYLVLGNYLLAREGATALTATNA